jgi:hypothetical protein
VPDMAEARRFYDGEYYRGLTWRFIRDEIGQRLRKRYEIPKDLPPKLLAMVRKLDDSDSLFPSRWQNDRDLLGG